MSGLLWFRNFSFGPVNHTWHPQVREIKVLNTHMSYFSVPMTLVYVVSLRLLWNIGHRWTVSTLVCFGAISSSCCRVSLFFLNLCAPFFPVFLGLRLPRLPSRFHVSACLASAVLFVSQGVTNPGPLCPFQLHRYWFLPFLCIPTGWWFMLYFI